jgi:hypothetical protein
VASERQKKAAVAGIVGAGVIGMLLSLPRAAAASAVATLTLSANPSSGLAPLSVVFSGAAADVNGSGVPGVSLYFYVDGVRAGPTVVTDASGTFEFEYTFAQSGTYDCVISTSAVSAAATVTV